MKKFILFHKSGLANNQHTHKSINQSMGYSDDKDELSIKCDRRTENPPSQNNEY